MKFDKIISQQAQRIIELENHLHDLKKSHKEIRKILFSIGAPLNDNVLCYSKEQLKPFLEISEILEYV